MSWMKAAAGRGESSGSSGGVNVQDTDAQWEDAGNAQHAHHHQESTDGDQKQTPHWTQPCHTNRLPSDLAEGPSLGKLNKNKNKGEETVGRISEM